MDKPKAPSLIKPVAPTAPTVPAKKVGGKAVVNLDNSPSTPATPKVTADSEVQKAAKAKIAEEKKAKVDADKKAKAEAAEAKRKEREEKRAAKELTKVPKLSQNGILQPSPGSYTRAVWDLVQNLSNSKGSLVTVPEVKAAVIAGKGKFLDKTGATCELDTTVSTIQVQYTKYCTFYGLTPAKAIKEPKPPKAVKEPKAEKVIAPKAVKAGKATVTIPKVQTPPVPPTPPTK